MRRRHVILGLVVLGFAVMAAVLHGRWQLADRPPQRYAECESNVAGADCARASEVFEDCPTTAVRMCPRARRIVMSAWTVCTPAT
ncbi:hypothetical protein [Nonomuraea sp. NPDC049758]|uniref:hypothetical protein n=1 Tax=Nonomuraea sp. NPDC049758 TaxID=3154360 RepID=UPI0034402314